MRRVVCGVVLPGLVMVGVADLPLVVVDRPAGSPGSYSDGVGQVRWDSRRQAGPARRALCPDQNIVTTYTQPGRLNLSRCAWGTSMAAPHVSGALAVLRSAGLGPRDAVVRLAAPPGTWIARDQPHLRPSMAEQGVGCRALIACQDQHRRVSRSDAANEVDDQQDNEDEDDSSDADVHALEIPGTVPA